MAATQGSTRKRGGLPALSPKLGRSPLHRAESTDTVSVRSASMRVDPGDMTAIFVAASQSIPASYSMTCRHSGKSGQWPAVGGEGFRFSQTDAAFRIPLQLPMPCERGAHGWLSGSAFPGGSHYLDRVWPQQSRSSPVPASAVTRPDHA